MWHLKIWWVNSFATRTVFSVSTTIRYAPIQCESAAHSSATWWKMLPFRICYLMPRVVTPFSVALGTKIPNNQLFIITGGRVTHSWKRPFPKFWNFCHAKRCYWFWAPRLPTPYRRMQLYGHPPKMLFHIDKIRVIREFLLRLGTRELRIRGYYV